MAKPSGDLWIPALRFAGPGTRLDNANAAPGLIRGLGQKKPREVISRGFFTQDLRGLAFLGGQVGQDARPGISFKAKGHRFTIDQDRLAVPNEDAAFIAL